MDINVPEEMRNIAQCRFLEKRRLRIEIYLE